MQTNINQGGKKNLKFSIQEEDNFIFARNAKVKPKVSFEIKNKLDQVIQQADEQLKNQAVADKQRDWITKDIQEKIDMRYAFYKNKVGEFVKTLDKAIQIKLAFNDVLFNQMNFKLEKFDSRTGVCTIKTDLTIPSIEDIEEEIKENEEKLKAEMERLKRQQEVFKLKLEQIKKAKEEKEKIKKGTNHIQNLERMARNA